MANLAQPSSSFSIHQFFAITMCREVIILKTSCLKGDQEKLHSAIFEETYELFTPIIVFRWCSLLFGRPLQKEKKMEAIDRWEEYFIANFVNLE